MQLKSAPLFVRFLSAAVILIVGAMNQACIAPAQTVTPRPCDLFAPATPRVAQIEWLLQHLDERMPLLAETGV